MNFSEIRHDYIWGPAVENGANGGHDLLAAVSIDAWKSADDNEEGEVLANVLLTAHGDMIVDFHDNGEDNTITYTAHFPDGKEMDVKCCGCRDESSWTEAVLFDKNGAELCCSEPADEYDGTWTLENEGVEYIVYIAVEK